MIVLAGSYWNYQGHFLPATVVAELEFDSVKPKPPPDPIEEEDEG
jgi:hypothetical protein